MPRPEPLLAHLLEPPTPSVGGFFMPEHEPLNFQELEDRREWFPGSYRFTGFEPAKTFSGRPARLVAGAVRLGPVGPSRPLRGVYPSARIGFEQPRRVLVCVRRQVRREVLHARGVAGSRGLRAAVRNVYSSISCRR